MIKLVESGRKKVEKSAKATERVGDFANGVLQCKAVVDLAVQNVPQAALPWAGVCIGLQILCNPAKESSASLEGIAHVTSRMEWYCAITEHVLSKKDINPGQTSYESVLGQLRGRTIALYQALLSYQMRSTCAFYRNKGLNFLRGLIILDDWDGQLQGVKDAEASLIHDSDQYNKEYAQDALGGIVRTGEATHKALGSIYQTLQDYIAAQKDRQTDNERNVCLQALRAVDPKVTIAKIEGIRDEVLREVYDWVLSTHEYQRFVEWTDKQQGRVLWIHGPAGTGKTMLFIGIIRELEAAPAVYAPSMSYLFCENDNEKANTPTAVLRSLIWLLLIQQPHLFSYILQDYKTSGAERFRDETAFFISTEL
ncbi:unnamed protein product [Penicillium salamii]|uniref:NWD NACHT-NTPase N-terminal domain-containing protein n=1 Tax=Penicillium salamii TaxID=1612424 RepID=A0A9W4NRW9_9EURO|nr:unnamed protein product [Penicillium salamii]